MKIKKLMFIFFLISSCLSFGQESVGKWDYPIKPGTEEWKQFQRTIDMIEACQIPDSVLQNISTNYLMILCLQYPLIRGVFAFDNINIGLEKFFNDFNGIRELAKREDAVNALSEQYLSKIRNFSEMLKTSPDFNIWYYNVECISILELIVTYSNFHTNASKEDQKKLLGSLWIGYNEKIKNSEHFSGQGFTTNLFARAHVIIKIDTVLSEKFEGRNKVVLFSGMANADLINTIDSLSYNLAK